MRSSKYLIFGLFLLILIPFLTFGQSVRIDSKTVTYTRPKPEMDFKKTFTVTYPLISGVPPKLARKIEDSISYRKVLSFNLENELNESQWLEEATFDVVYNKRGILNVYLSFSGTAAYPSYSGKNAIVDLKTGNRITVRDVFTNIPNLLKKIRQIQKAEIKDSIRQIKKDPDFYNTDTDSLFQFAIFQRIHLEDFSINDAGVTFHYSYSFPRIYMTIEPTGNYFLSWKEIKPFIRNDGLLGKFIR